MLKHAPRSTATTAAADRADTAKSSASELTEAGTEPVLVPFIAEVLRTRYCAPGSIVLVEGMDVVYPDLSTISRSRLRSSGSTSQSWSQPPMRRWRVVRLLLGDGNLCIQALLAPEMHRYMDAGEIALGSYIRLGRFRLEWLDAEDDRGPSVGRKDTIVESEGRQTLREDYAVEGEKTVYLVIEDTVLVGQNGSHVKIERPPEQYADDENEELPPPPSSPTQSPSRARQVRKAAVDKARQSPGKFGPEQGGFLEDPTGELDSNPSPKTIPVPRQETGLDENSASSHQLVPQPPPAPRVQVAHQRHRTRRPSWQSTDPSRPLKLTPLRAIPHLPFKQNWSVNVLAIATAVSEIEPSGIPPYTQRRAWLADPSTPKRVLLTVFLDPAQFAPRVGSALLLLGVKNHRFDGGCLKKYASDRPEGSGDGETGGNSEAQWWFEDPDELGWCDALGLRKWWEGQQQQGKGINIGST